MATPSKKGAKSEVEVAAEAKRKKQILDQVAQSNLPTKTILKELGISRSTYYSWLKRYEEEGEEGLLDSRSLPKAKEEVKETVAEIDEAEPKVAEVEPAAEVVGDTPPSLEAETVEAVEPTPPEPEEPVVAPEEPVEAPVKEEPKRREQVVRPIETPPVVGGKEKKGIGAYALIAIFLLAVGLLLSISSSNYNTYNLQQSGETLTLWKGKFAPKGSKMVDSFEPVVVGEMDVTYLTRRKFGDIDEVYQAISAFFLDQVDTEVGLGDQADRVKITALLKRAEEMLASGSEGSPALSEPRFRLAQKRVAIAESDLKKAYENALPAFEEAARMGLGDAAELETKIKAMQAALAPASDETVEAEQAEEAESAAAPETAGEETVTPAASEEEPTQEAEVSAKDETHGQEAESAATTEESEEKPEVAETAASLEEPAPEAEVSEEDETHGQEAESAVAAEESGEKPEVAETAPSPTEQETLSEEVERAHKSY